MSCSPTYTTIFRHWSQLENVVVKVPTKNNISKFSISTNLNLYSPKRMMVIVPLNGKNKGRTIRIEDLKTERFDFKETLECRVSLRSNETGLWYDDRSVVNAFSRKLHKTPWYEREAFLDKLGLPNETFKVVKRYIAHYEIFSPSNGVMFYKVKFTENHKDTRPKIDKACYKQITKAANTIAAQDKQIRNMKRDISDLRRSLERKKPTARYVGKILADKDREIDALEQKVVEASETVTRMYAENITDPIVKHIPPTPPSPPPLERRKPDQRIPECEDDVTQDFVDRLL